MKYVIGYAVGSFIMWIVYYKHVKRIVNDQPKPTECNCISSIEYKHRYERHEMFTDSLRWSEQRKDKARTKRLQDSVNKSLQSLNF